MISNIYRPQKRCYAYQFIYCFQKWNTFYDY